MSTRLREQMVEQRHHSGTGYESWELLKNILKKLKLMKKFS
jgi:hypothetical protein